LARTAIAAMSQGSIDSAILSILPWTCWQGKNRAAKSHRHPHPHEYASSFGRRLSRRLPFIPGRLIEAIRKKRKRGDGNRQKRSPGSIRTPREIWRDAGESRRPDKAGYLSSLKTTIPMYSTHRHDGSQGRGAVLAVFSLSSPRRQGQYVSQDLYQQYVEAAGRRLDEY